MSKHTPFIVVPQGAFVSVNLYKLREGKDPIYNKYAEGSLSDMTELANQLNYLEAEKHSELAVAEAPLEKGMKERGPEEPPEAVGIPTEPDAQHHESIIYAIGREVEFADAGRLNLVQFKRRVSALITEHDERKR